MNMREKLKSSRQHTIITLAIIMAFSIASLLVTAEWYKKNYEYKHVIESYSDKVAFDECVNKVKKVNDKTLSQIIVEIKCEKKWGVWERVKKEPPLFTEFILKDIGQILIAIAIIAACIYILIYTYVLYATCKNLGWKRVAIIVSFIPGIILAAFVYNDAGFTIRDEEYLLILFSGLGGYIFSIFTILGGRNVAIWIKDGFNSSQ